MILRRLFAIPEEDVTFARRGFRGGSSEVRAHVEKIGLSFLSGYHAALEDSRPEPLARRLDATEPDYRGFAFEGAAMSLSMLDTLVPGRRRRLRAFLEGAGGAHVYMAHVGAGWAVARVPVGRRAALGRLDPVLRWLAFDGWGFHQGYFHWPCSVEGRQEVPRWIQGYGRRAFDQGLGRSLWFVDGADVERIPATVATFAPARQADLWSGVGLAATYAGGVGRRSLKALAAAAGSFLPHLAQGAAFAAEARQRAGNPTPSTALASEIFCGLSPAAAAEVTHVARPDLPDGDLPVFEVWRQRIRSRLAAAEPETEAAAAGGRR